MCLSLAATQSQLKVAFREMVETFVQHLTFIEHLLHINLIMYIGIYINNYMIHIEVKAIQRKLLNVFRECVG